MTRNKRIRKGFLWMLPAAGMLILNACGTGKLAKDELLYTGAKVKIINDTLAKNDKTDLKDGLEKNLTPKPNTNFLGLRPRVFIHNITPEPKKQKGLLYWLKYRIGEEPVLFGQVDRNLNRDILENYAQNKGYFNARVDYDSTRHGKTASMEYSVKTGARYRMRNILFPQDSTTINKEIQAVKDKSLLKPGRPFDLDVIKAERVRIDNRLKERGFYYFSPDNIIVQADSTVSKKPEAEMIVKLKSNTPELSKEQFSIDKVIIFPDYNIADVTENIYSVPVNTDSATRYKGFYIVDPKKKFNPKIFDRALYFKEGDLYNRSNHNLTLNRLISLGTFKFVKNEFIIADSTAHTFDAYYLLTPKDFQSLNVELLAKTNSANYGGSEANLTWTHNNLFKGAENLKITAFGGFDVQMGGRAEGERREGNIIRFGAKGELSIPRLITPFNFHSSSAFVPRTVASLGYEFVSRSNWYRLHNFSAAFGYTWKENIKKEHQLKLLDATLVEPQNVTESYKLYIADKPYLQRAIEEQLIYGPTYTFTYTDTFSEKPNSIYYRGMLDLAGNLTGLAMGANVKQDKQKEIFGIPFSQYAKIENDFRYYHRFANRHTLATRLVAGLALPYGNSLYVPFSRQFFGGGSTDLRGFRARTLGPGSYDPRTPTTPYALFDQGGDIKLELNAEYRPKIYKFIEGAIFADAGNIWLVNEDPSRPGARFSGSWLSEIAVDAGVGLRLDFSILLLRLDLAMPLRVPYYEKDNRWMFNKIEFGNPTWRNQNLMLNIAIGYPF